METVNDVLRLLVTSSRATLSDTQIDEALAVIDKSEAPADAPAEGTGA